MNPPRRRRRTALTLCALLCLLPSLALAGSLRQGAVTVYYNALAASALPAASARAYGIEHSPRQGLVVVTAHDASGARDRSLPLTVSGQATTLLGRTLTPRFKPINENGSHSVLVLFQVQPHETVNFQLTIQTADNAPIKLHFTHQYGG